MSFPKESPFAQEQRVQERYAKDQLQRKVDETLDAIQSLASLNPHVASRFEELVTRLREEGNTDTDLTQFLEDVAEEVKRFV